MCTPLPLSVQFFALWKGASSHSAVLLQGGMLSLGGIPLEAQRVGDYKPWIFVASSKSFAVNPPALCVIRLMLTRFHEFDQSG